MTLSAPADLTGKHVIVRNPDGAQVDYVSALRGFFVENSVAELSTTQPIFPQQTYTAVHPWASFFLAIALENQSLDPVSVTFETQDSTARNAPLRGTITLPSGSIYMTYVPFFFSSSHLAEFYVYSSAPIRMVDLAVPDCEPLCMGNSIASLTAPAAPLVLKTDLEPVEGFQTSNFLSWDWQIGSAAPVPKSLNVFLNDAPTPFAASATTALGGNWLSVTPTEGTTCFAYYVGCPSSSLITVTVDPSSLAPGVHSGTITVNPMAPNAVLVPTTMNVTFHAAAEPVISITGPPLKFLANPPGSAPDPLSLSVTSSGDPVAISVTTSTDSGVNWLSVTPSQTLTPATLIVSAIPAVLSAPDSGTITIAGPANSPTVVASINANFPPPPPPPAIAASPSALLFSVKAGSAPPKPQSVHVFPSNYVYSPVFSGGAWLSAQGYQGSIVVTVNPDGLMAGSYQGIVKIGTLEVTVKLVVWNSPVPTLTVTPSTLDLTAPSGGSATKTLYFATGDISVAWTFVTLTADGSGWLGACRPGPCLDFTPSSVDITADATNLAAGTSYHGMVVSFR